MLAWHIVAISVGLWIGLVSAAWWSERMAWNGGRCRVCGGKMVCFDMDSQGGRGWCCRNHERTVYGPWISYPFIDGH